MLWSGIVREKAKKIFMNNNIEILPLSISKENELLKLIFASLQEGDCLSIFGKLKANHKNCHAFYKREILPLIINKDPCLYIAENKKIIGFTCCNTGINKAYDLESLTAVGFITVVHPNKRRQGFGSRLRLALKDELEKRKIKKFIFGIRADNEASLLNAKKLLTQIRKDAKIISYQFEGNV